MLLCKIPRFHIVLTRICLTMKQIRCACPSPVTLMLPKIFPPPPIVWVIIEGFTLFQDMKKYNHEECQEDVKAAMSGDMCRVSNSDTHLLRKAYHSALSFTDAQLGRVMKELKDQGLDKDTIIVLCTWADHGWKLGEHNMWRKFSNFEERYSRSIHAASSGCD